MVKFGFKNTLSSWVMEVHAYDPSGSQRQARQISVVVQGQAALQIEFQDSLDCYTEKPFLEKPKPSQTNKQTNKQKTTLS